MIFECEVCKERIDIYSYSITKKGYFVNNKEITHCDKPMKLIAEDIPKPQEISFAINFNSLSLEGKQEFLKKRSRDHNKLMKKGKVDN